MENAYERYFRQQAGGGSGPDPIGNVYKASYAQQRGRGGGCCGIGRVLTAAASPFIAKGLQAVSEEALRLGVGLYSDIQRDPSLRSAGRATVQRLRNAGSNLKRRARAVLRGSGASRSKGRKSAAVKVKKRKPAAKARKTTTSRPRATRGRIKATPKRDRGQTGRGAQRVKTPSSPIPPDIFS